MVLTVAIDQNGSYSDTHKPDDSNILHHSLNLQNGHSMVPNYSNTWDQESRDASINHGHEAPDYIDARFSDPRLRSDHSNEIIGQHYGPARSTIYKTPPDTPASRTGPPRSLSFAYSFPHIPPSKDNSKQEYGVMNNSEVVQDLTYGAENSFSYASTDFRGALEFSNSSNNVDRKGKRRERSYTDDNWNLRRWFQESPKDSPKEEKQIDLPVPDVDETPAKRDQGRNDTKEQQIGQTDNEKGASAKKVNIRRAFSVARTRSEQSSNKQSHDGKAGNVKWARLRALLPQIVHPDESILPGPSAVTSQAVNITDELITGGLSTLMLRLWFERDEKGQRRVPILFHRLRIRISDSLHPMHGNKSVFRIECEYANGAARWVVYRQLRDFISLHTHYTVSNVYNRNVDKMPEFPRTSLPYFKFLKKEGNQVGRADFARLQREALETYLVSLIRAVMFHPSTNRLAGFLEVSATSIALAQSGGAQYKAGYLLVAPSGSIGLGRKSASWKAKKESRWCAVRESYLVVSEEPGEFTVWDVFLFDSDFKIERPKRYYRQGLNTLLHSEGRDGNRDGRTHSDLQQHNYTEHTSFIGAIRSCLVDFFHHRANAKHGASANGVNNRQSVDAGSMSSGASSVSHQPTPMLDPSTNANPLVEHSGNDARHETDEAKIKTNTKNISKHIFYIINSQMRLKLYARNERQMLQWITALEKVAATSHYTGKNRFESFAPIRLNVAAQWLVDGRDYFWNLSRAILLARESIYIHDWWLSPELLMRRPNKDRYRLDRLLERKAKEGVKIYIILYQEVSNRTTPTDSNYTKQRLISLHPNIMVQRSPSHFQTGTFYWAHHEKMCVIDQAISFMGGIDLCFGRWDTAQHVLTDDTEDTDRPQIWPGKDYSNPRISDFTNLNKPEEDMYDRSKVPRMPWHDVAMQVVGQPARDLARHFVERWNYLLRIKNHSRVMPFLLPPPEFRPGELTRLGLTGTCEMQICRSAGPWSLGTPGKIEHSIQNAYLKAIQMSEHFVYIENQFFITSTVVNDVKVENNIGDAIVHRIIRAHRDGTPWKCCIMIPLLPGFTFPVDHSDASALRIILECQNRTIARGPNSIFSRLKKEGIDPDEYISVFSLRNWAKLRGDVLTTEQVYIHGKVCIVDDRLAIIGSANINERSQRGDRDSELASVIRDTDMIDCTMAGKPFQVGRFAHTLRVRLMREHLGVDVDALDEEDLMSNDPTKAEYQQEDAWDPEAEQAYGKESGVTHVKKSKQHTPAGVLLGTGVDSINQALHAGGEATSSSATKALHKMGLSHNSQNAGDETLRAERKDFNRQGQMETGFASSVVPTLEEKTILDRRPPMEQTSHGGASFQKQTIYEEPENMDDVRENSKSKEEEDAPQQLLTDDGVLFGAPANAGQPQVDDKPPLRSDNDADEEQAAPAARSKLRKHLNSKLGNKTYTVPVPRPQVDPHGFEDPVADSFWKNVWVASAVRNTEIYRKVFHAIPDDLITTWKQYKEFVVQHERLNKPARGSNTPDPVARMPSESGDEGALGRESTPVDVVDVASDVSKEGADETPEMQANSSSSGNTAESKPRRQAKGSEPYEKWEREEMEKLLGELNGHLVIHPTRFLEGEDIANNFLFNADRLLPLPIYN